MVLEDVRWPDSKVWQGSQQSRQETPLAIESNNEPWPLSFALGVGSEFQRGQIKRQPPVPREVGNQGEAEKQQHTPVLRM